MNYRYVVVYRNDSEVYGPFVSERDATSWVYTLPNALFDTEEELSLAEDQSDFFVCRLRDPKEVRY